jgi:hypothetical protein
MLRKASTKLCASFAGAPRRTTSGTLSTRRCAPVRSNPNRSWRACSVAADPPANATTRTSYTSPPSPPARCFPLAATIDPESLASPRARIYHRLVLLPSAARGSHTGRACARVWRSTLVSERMPERMQAADSCNAGLRTPEQERSRERCTRRDAYRRVQLYEQRLSHTGTGDRDR